MLLMIVAFAAQLAPDCHGAPRGERAACAAAAVKAAEDFTREVGTDCIEPVVTLDLNACLALDLAREEERMFNYLELAEQRAWQEDRERLDMGEPTSTGAFLSSSQMAWRAYAEIECEGVYDRWKAGTIRGAMSLHCWIDLTRERSHRIWAHHLTFINGSAPLAPEPIRTVADELARN